MDSTTPPDKASGSDTPTSNHDFQKNVSKRLSDMTDRQDSIQALSMWMIHHKSECQKIASCWLSALKRAKIPRRLHLFYLANDVVQNCKKRNAKIFLLAFKNVLKDAVVLVRDHSISNKIERIFAIWEERNTYFIDFVNELRELLKNREKVTEHVSATNFKPQDVAEALSKVKMLETHVGMKQKQVANLKIDASKIEAVKQLKDRSHSHQFAKQFDDSYTKMQGYVKILENEIEQRSHLIELLENGQTFYEVQNDDAMVVANAYRNFGIRINNLRKRLNDYKDTLSGDGDSPIPSPSAEAPSPGNTPPQEYGDAEEMDMEMSDNEESPDKSSSIIAAEPFTAAGTSSSLTDRIANMASRAANADPRSKISAAAASASPTKQKTKSGGTNNAINYLSSLISAKASQPVRAAKDKAVLKNLEEFAEKVKNPPPVSWSDYKRKQQQKLLAAAATTATTTNANEEAAHESAGKLVSSSPEPSSLDDNNVSPTPPTSQDYSPAVSISQHSSQSAVAETVLDTAPAASQATEVAATLQSNQSEQSMDELANEQSDLSPTPATQSNVSTSNETDTAHSMSWPPSEPTSFPTSKSTSFSSSQSSEPTATVTSEPTATVISTPSGVATVALVTPPVCPPLRPPPMFSGVMRLTSPIQPGSVSMGSVRPPPPPVSRPPAHTSQQLSSTVRVSPAVVVQAPLPPEQCNLSTEDQMDALDMLDSLHANTVQTKPVRVVSVNANYQPTNSSVRLIPEHQLRQRAVHSITRPMMRPGVQPIRTLGDRRPIMAVHRSPMRFPPQPPAHMERLPYSPPHKRPYQDFSQGYPYQGGGGGGYY